MNAAEEMQSVTGLQRKEFPATSERKNHVSKTFEVGTGATPEDIPYSVTGRLGVCAGFRDLGKKSAQPAGVAQWLSIDL